MEQNLSEPLASSVTPWSMRTIPKTYLVIFGWFSYQFFSSLFSLISRLVTYGITQMFMPMVQGQFFALFGVSLISLILYGLLGWGMVIHKSWLRMVVVVWYVITLLIVGYTIYPILNSVGYNAMNEFYVLPGGGSLKWIIFIPVLLNVVVNTGILYYFFKKTDLIKT
jgi:hypothetical protein